MKWLMCTTFVTVMAAVTADWKMDKPKNKNKLPATTEICATDGVVYANKCAFIKQQCEVDRNLEWQPMQLCTSANENSGGNAKKGKKKRGKKEKFSTFCGSNGKTYEDNCSFKLAHCTDSTLKVAFMGKCGDCSAENLCPKSDKMVPKYLRGKSKKICGTDGKQYDNYCEFKKARCLLLKDGGPFLDYTSMYALSGGFY